MADVLTSSYAHVAEHAKECRRLHGMAVQISMALLLYLVGLTIYAARRRTELRERFNIAGAPPFTLSDPHLQPSTRRRSSRPLVLLAASCSFAVLD